MPYLETALFSMVSFIQRLPGVSIGHMMSKYLQFFIGFLPHDDVFREFIHDSRFFFAETDACVICLCLT